MSGRNPERRKVVSAEKIYYKFFCPTFEKHAEKIKKTKVILDFF
jgi:hypothetical protein